MNRIEIIGQVFGRWQVIAEAGKANGKRHVLCACECGKESAVRLTALTGGKSRSCGCCLIKPSGIPPGTRYGRLVVIGDAPSVKQGLDMRKRLFVRCDCGVELMVNKYNLKTGNSLSCGCLRDEVRAVATRKHGHNRKAMRSREYNTWASMKSRCANPNNSHYAYYGGRGIKVCERWLNDFPAFLANMGPKPEGMSLDRIDSDGGYQPDNCRWATNETQARNTRRNRRLTHEGLTLTLSEWSLRVGLSGGAIIHRLEVLGWEVARALTEPRNDAHRKS